MNLGIDWTGWPVSPLRLAVTGPLVPMMIVEYRSWPFPVLLTTRMNDVVPGIGRTWTLVSKCRC